MFWIYFILPVKRGAKIVLAKRGINILLILLIIFLWNRFPFIVINKEYLGFYLYCGIIGFQLFSVLFEWLITSQKFDKIMYLQGFPFLIILVCSLTSFLLIYCHHVFVAYFLLALLLFVALINNFKIILVNNIYIGFIGITCLFSASVKINLSLNLNIFFGMGVTLYICEWLINLLVQLRENDKKEIQDLIAGSGMVGTCIVVILVLIEKILY